jgi:hypothetical protein
MVGPREVKVLDLVISLTVFAQIANLGGNWIWNEYIHGDVTLGAILVG